MKFKLFAQCLAFVVCSFAFVSLPAFADSSGYPSASFDVGSECKVATNKKGETVIRCCRRDMNYCADIPIPFALNVAEIDWAKKPKPTTNKQKCLNDGGTWDSKTQTCKAWIAFKKTVKPPPDVGCPAGYTWYLGKCYKVERTAV